MHFGEANDANEATPPWIQDLSFDIELVSFREANLKITTSKMGQISMSMDANGISVKSGVINQWKWTWANHGQPICCQLLLLMQVVKGMDLIGWNSQTVKVGM